LVLKFLKKIGFLTTTDSLPVHHEIHRFFDVWKITGTNRFSNFDIFSFQKKQNRQFSGSEKCLEEGTSGYIKSK